MRLLHVTLVRLHARLPASEQLARWPVLRDSLAALAARGHDVLSLVAGHADDEAAAGGAGVRFVAEPGLARALARPARLAAAAREFAPDVVHLHGLHFAWRARRLVDGLPGAAVLVQDHAGRPPRDAWRRLAMRRGVRRMRGCLFTAAEQAAEFVHACALDAGTRVWEAIEGSCRFTPGDREAARRASGLYGDPCVLWIGHLDRNKDPRTALVSLGALQDRMPNLHAWFCYGAAPLERDVRAWLASDAWLEGHVHLVGPVPHEAVESYCRAADLFLLASHREGCNLSTIEALACGTPVVATSIPSQRRVAGDAGTYFAPGDARQAADALLAAAANTSADRRAAVRRHFERVLSYEAIAARLEQVYGEALGR